MANFTKQAIKASFMKLLSQKPLSKISVRDIVEELRHQPQLVLLPLSGHPVPAGGDRHGADG